MARLGRPTGLLIPRLLLPAAFLAGGGIGHLLAGKTAGSLTRLLEANWQGEEAEPVSRTLDALWSDGRCLLLALLFAVSAIGVVGLPLLLLAEGFQAGYLLSGLGRAWGAEGLRLGFVWIGVRQMLLLFLLLLIALPGWTYAWDLAAQNRSARRILPGNARRYLLGCLAGVLILLLYEILLWNFLTPALEANR